MIPEAHPERSAESEPILLLGAHRSGTTLLGLMLRHHPSVAWLGEFEYAVDFMLPGGGWPERPRFLEQLAGDRRYRRQAFEVAPELSPRALVDSFFAQTRQRQAKPRVGAAFHRHFDRVAGQWPEGRVVHLVRDGRDVALSRIGMGWAGNPWLAASEWARVERSWDALRSRLDPERWIELRFEELVAEPEAQLRRLCGFLGLDFSDQMLSYPENSGYERPDPALASQWRRRLTPRQASLLEHEIGPLLRARGYPAAAQPARAPSRFEALALRFQDRAYRLRFRLRRYGLPLVLADFVARRARLAGLRRSVQRRLDRITESHLR